MADEITLDKAVLSGDIEGLSLLNAGGAAAVGPLQALWLGLLLRVSNELKALKREQAAERQMPPVSQRADADLQRFQTAARHPVD